MGRRPSKAKAGRGGLGGQAGKGGTAPVLRTTSLVFPSYLDVPFSPITGEAGPQHGKGRWGGEDRKKHPVGFGPFTKQGGGFSQKQRVEHPHEPESIPLDRVRKKGKEEAAPAATQQYGEGKRCEGL